MNARADDRFGSAAPATERSMRGAGIISGNRGAFFGYYRRLACRQPSDGSIALFGGAGSGKSACVYAENELSDYLGCNSITFDPRGELAAIGTLAATMQGYAQYTFNPFGVSWCPQHRTNPLDHLHRDSPTLIADTRKAVMDLLPSTNGKHWWQDDAHEWVVAFMLGVVERDGIASLPSVYRELMAVSGDFDVWTAFFDHLEASRFPEVRRVATIIATAQKSSRGEGFRAPMNTIANTFAFMQEPSIAAALTDPDFSLSVVNNTRAKAKVKIIVPLQHLGLCRGLVRLLLGRPVQDKLRIGGHDPIAVLIDECGQLGHFPSVTDVYSFGRGAKIFGLCAWQEIAQLFDAFGQDGGNAIIGSAQLRVFAGVRTIETAKMVSSMAGTTTLHYDDKQRQNEARHRRQMAAASFLNGGDPVQSLGEMRHHRQMETIQSQTSRPLMTPDEVMSHKGMIAFASGIVEGAIFGEWTPHFLRPELAGKYLANPYHAPDHVTLKSRFGFTRKARVVTEACPPALLHYPQYQGGTWRYVEGHKPKIRR